MRFLEGVGVNWRENHEAMGKGQWQQNLVTKRGIREHVALRDKATVCYITCFFPYTIKALSLCPFLLAWNTEIWLLVICRKINLTVIYRMYSKGKAKSELSVRRTQQCCRWVTMGFQTMEMETVGKSHSQTINSVLVHLPLIYILILMFFYHWHSKHIS